MPILYLDLHTINPQPPLIPAKPADSSTTQYSECIFHFAHLGVGRDYISGCIGCEPVTVFLQDYHRHRTHGHRAMDLFLLEQAGVLLPCASGFGTTEPASWFQVNCPSCTAANRGPRMGAGRRAPLSAVAAHAGSSHAGSSHAGALRAATPSAAHAAAAGQARRERVRRAAAVVVRGGQ